MMAKLHATRTFAPLQFEALEPHRFEDLVRDLIYDFRDWQTMRLRAAAEAMTVMTFERSKGV